MLKNAYDLGLLVMSVLKITNGWSFIWHILSKYKYKCEHTKDRGVNGQQTEDLE